MNSLITTRNSTPDRIHIDHVYVLSSIFNSSSTYQEAEDLKDTGDELVDETWLFTYGVMEGTSSAL